MPPNTAAAESSMAPKAAPRSDAIVTEPAAAQPPNCSRNRANTCSMPIQISSAAAVTPSCSSAPAEARNRVDRSGSFIHCVSRTASGAGVVGPRIAATSTTEVENARTANTASLICR